MNTNTINFEEIRASFRKLDYDSSDDDKHKNSIKLASSGQ